MAPTPAANAAAEAENAAIQAICVSAFEAERQHNWRGAFDLHVQAITRLGQVVAKQTGWFTNETKRVAEKQIKFHCARREMLRPLVNGTPGAKIPVLLPTAQSAVESIMAVKPDGTATISSDQILLMHWKQIQASQPNAAVPANIAPLLAKPAPFYTPTLDTNVPETLFHIYNSVTSSFLRGIWVYFKARDATDSQVQYVLQTMKRTRYQINLTTFHRSSQFATPIVATHVTPIQISSNDSMNMFIGRPMKHHLPYGTIIDEIPDRFTPKQHKAKWAPRRFTYGGRRFVWKADTRGSWKQGTAEALYEVKREWPVAGSKTGKMMDECFPVKLAWTDLKMGLKKVAVLHVHGDVDQLFREYILASWMTREMVMLIGHQ